MQKLMSEEISGFLLPQVRMTKRLAVVMATKKMAKTAGLTSETADIRLNTLSGGFV